MAIIVGMDEVGRGCWAGPLVVGAVILRNPIEGLKDSKLLNGKQREQLAEHIYQQADVGLGWATAKQVDDLGLTHATTLAMQFALAELTEAWDEVIVDGSYNYLHATTNTKAVPKADMDIPCVSAASIVAKVARDNYMYQAALEFPDYGFERHVGYGTLHHRQRLAVLGPCSLHRMSYKPVIAVTL